VYLRPAEYLRQRQRDVGYRDSPSRHQGAVLPQSLTNYPSAALAMRSVSEAECVLPLQLPPASNRCQEALATAR
jgi:hypothetical protein